MQKLYCIAIALSSGMVKMLFFLIWSKLKGERIKMFFNEKCINHSILLYFDLVYHISYQIKNNIFLTLTNFCTTNNFSFSPISLLHLTSHFFPPKQGITSLNAKTARARQIIGPVHASVVSVHRAVPVEISCNESGRGGSGSGSGVLINNRVVLPPTGPHKKSSNSYYVTLADDEEGTCTWPYLKYNWWPFESIIIFKLVLFNFAQILIIA